MEGPAHGPGGAAVLLAGRYRVGELIGEGGMSSVHRAADELLHREVAVKRMRLNQHDTAAERTAARERLLREARVAASLKHPHVVTVHDVVQDAEGDPWLVMEYLPSRSLGGVLRERGALSPARVAEVGMQLADALAAAHAGGVVHRDVKPDNVLVIAQSAVQVKLLDFGISHSATGPALTRTGMLVGTPAYLAPEVARGAPADARSDVWALGATLYAAVEGHPPFSGDDVFAILGRVATGDVPPPTRSGRLAPLLRALLEPDPAARPTAAAAHAALRRWASVLATPTVEDPPRRDDPPGPVGLIAHPDQRGSRGARRSTLITAGAVLVVVALVAGAVALFGQADPSAPAPGVAAPAVPAVPPSSPVEPPLPDIGPVTLGDPRTADPCSVLDPVGLQRFGRGEYSRLNADLNACRIDVTAADESYVSVFVTFERPGEVGLLGGTTEQLGRATLARYSLSSSGNSCSRRVLLADRSSVEIRVLRFTPNAFDLCAVAETATAGVLQRLATGSVGTRVPLDSVLPLASVAACDLLTATDLAVVPSVDAAAGKAGFAGWTCRWEADEDTGPEAVEVRLTRQFSSATDDADARTFGDRTGQVVRSAASCRADVVSRTYQMEDPDDPGSVDDVEDVARIDVIGGAATDEQRCAWASTWGETIAPRLPR